MTDREVIDKIEWFMHEHAHNKEICDYLINILAEREKQNKKSIKVTVKKKTKEQLEIEAIADVIEMGECFFGVDPGYFGIPGSRAIELAQARALYEAGYRKVE